MLYYTDIEIKRLLESIFNTNLFTIIPVGNHHLKRHLVYEITLKNNKKYIFKLYYKKRRRSREIASLNILKESSIRCPKIYTYGHFESHEWLIIEYIDGVLFDHIISEITYQNKIKLFHEVGEELGKLHSYKTFELFGEWDEEGNFITPFNNYYDYFTRVMENIFETIMNKELPNKDLLIKAIKITKDHLELFNQPFASRLTHNDFDGRNILVKKINDEYTLSGIIDFEGCIPKNSEEDFIGLYYRYLLKDPILEDAFLSGYKKYLNIDLHFKDRLHIHLLSFVLGNCSWAYDQAQDYYFENIEFLKSLVI